MMNNVFEKDTIDFLWEYRELYLWGNEELAAAGVPEPAVDARYLLEAVCGTNRNTLLADPKRRVSAGEKYKYKEYIGERKKRIPLQYILGVQEFMGLEFLVNEKVLIPRQDTECLVEEVLRFLQDGSEILDLCTGSGCILLSLLHFSNYCKGTGVDISLEALRVARENEKRIAGLWHPNPWQEDTVVFLQSDLFEEVPKKEFDFIVSNPPYIASRVIPSLMDEVRLYEPVIALDGKEDGLHFYRRIIVESSAYLRKEGMLFFEIGYDQAEAVKELMEKSGFEEVTVVKDLAGLDRVVYGMRR